MDGCLVCSRGCDGMTNTGQYLGIRKVCVRMKSEPVLCDLSCSQTVNVLLLLLLLTPLYLLPRLVGVGCLAQRLRVYAEQFS